MGVLAHGLVILQLIVFPVWSLFELKKLKKTNQLDRRLVSYTVMFLVLILSVFVAARILSWNELIIHPDVEAPAGWLYGVLIALTSWLLLTQLIPVILMLARQPLFMEKLRENFLDRKFIYPLTRKHRIWFILVTVAVAVGEEVVFRSFFVYYLAEWFGDLSFWWIVLLANIVFGFVHFQQGLSGVLNGFLFGMVMSFLWYGSGSLLIPIIVHLFFDWKLIWMSRRFEQHT